LAPFDADSGGLSAAETSNEADSGGLSAAEASDEADSGGLSAAEASNEGNLATVRIGHCRTNSDNKSRTPSPASDPFRGRGPQLV